MTLKKQENLVYSVIWLILLLLPLTKLLGGGAYLSESEGIRHAILRTWLFIAPLFVLFLLHNFIALPFLFSKNRKPLYAVITILLLSAFFIYAFLSRDKNESGMRPGPDGPRIERMDGQRIPPDNRFTDTPLPKDHWREVTPPSGANRKKAPMKPFSPDLMYLLLALLVIGINLAIKLFFRSIQNEREMKELEQENLNSQLQYLRYQISPHFFMNTLNNIHALVDIDPELAKDSILRLSKLMRYMLYEGDKPTIPLEKEIGFLSQYISLMRLRFNDSVKISFSVPESVPEIEIPPLLFISFVENAFKHGVSYQKNSFIEVSVSFIDGRLTFTCRNSKHKEAGTGKTGGVGMNNTRHRLDLLYGQEYTMDVEDNDNEYSVRVEIPAPVKQ